MGSPFNAGLPNNAPPGVRQKVQKFITTGYWRKVAGVDWIEVFLVGAGGGGGGKDSSLAAATGSGGGGAVVRQWIYVGDLPVGTLILVTIGAGGNGGSTAGTAGQVGGSTSFGVLVIALGGGGGSGFSSSAAVDSGVTTGIATQGGGSVTIGVNGSICGIGAGALSSAKYGHILQGNSTPLAGAVYCALRAAVQGVMRGHTALSNAASIMQAQIDANVGVDGLGAPGGMTVEPFGVSLSVSRLAGHLASKNAVANSGCGGAGVYQTNAATAEAGGNGGSGYAQITWVEADRA